MIWLGFKKVPKTSHYHPINCTNQTLLQFYCIIINFTVLEFVFLTCLRFGFWWQSQQKNMRGKMNQGKLLVGATPFDDTEKGGRLFNMSYQCNNNNLLFIIINNYYY